MKKLFVSLFVVMILLALALPVMAQDPGQRPDPEHGYGTQPGYVVSAEQTTCQGHGSFGAFGEQSDIVHDFGINYPGSNGKPGANGYQTGINNSSLCGNR